MPELAQGGATETRLEQKAQHADPGVEDGEGAEEGPRREALGGLGLEQEVDDRLHHGPEQDHEGDVSKVGVAEEDGGGRSSAEGRRPRASRRPRAPGRRREAAERDQTRAPLREGQQRRASQASAPPVTPPAVAPVPIEPTARRAVYGSKRSFTSDQKPDTSARPNAATCR